MINMDTRKIERAIKLIQAGAEMAASKGQPIEVCYSGGKDSDVILELAKMAGVNYRAIYKNTTIDPSGTISHVKENGVEIVRPKESFLQLISKKGLPNRHMRFCCSELKEYKILDYAIMGVRRDESVKRANRYKEPEECRHYQKGKVRAYYPIVDWTLDDVADFITDRHIKLAPVYYNEDGTIDFTKRLGCMCCPLATDKKRLAEFHKTPNMLKLYARGGQFLDNHKDNPRLQELWNGDVYKMIVCNLFCHSSYYDFLERFGRNLFDDGIDCKTFLEQQFNIKL